MMEHGCLAVAIVQRQVMVVQASRSHSSRESQLDVHTFIPFGSNVFLSSPVPEARISSSDILTIFPTSDRISCDSAGMGEILELSPRAYREFIELSSRMQKKYERLFDVWSRKSRH
ncbi:hypothetical protein BC835DRAFT_1314764 [Cytidiella melzeri]|nr:hypothetical protein BC835DRAFT_1314764 [Cytidiella melzeri]